ncbi:MAG: flagellin [Sarcina sp.]
MIINHNMNAMAAHRQMGINTGNQGKSIEKLSSGQRINRAGDDAAGLAISEKMRGQIRGLDGASTNAQDGVSLIQTAEGALNETHNILQRMRELSVQGANDTNVTEDRDAITKEMDALKEEIDRISSDTEFNGQKLLNGDFKDKNLQIGANTNQSVGLDIKGMNSEDLGLTGTGIAEGDVEVKTNPTSTITIAADQEATIAGNITIEGVDIALAAGDTTAEMATKINEAVTGGKNPELAGVKAEVDGAGVLTITLTSEEKNTLTVTDNTGTGAISGITASAAVEGAVITEPIKAAYEFNDEKFEVEIAKGDTAESITEKLKAATSSTTISATFEDGKLKITDSAAGNTASVTGEVLNKVDISDHKSATNSIKTLDNAINSVSSQRADLGALQNRLEHTIATNDNSAENLQAAESRIRDVDMAKEMMSLSKNNVLVQAAQSMLGQANQQPNQVLSLLR